MADTASLSRAAADVVPPDVLEASGAVPRRARHDYALVIDSYLRRLARQDACGRRVLGTLAAAFLARKGQHALGFARLRDYARERLGLSARELQSLARVTRRMSDLPAVAAAFAAGELSWTHVRLVVTVATPDTAPLWVERARDRTVRALEATIRRETGKPVERADTIDDEPRVQVRIPCPREVRAKWHAVTVLARAVAGSEMAPWEVAEAVAAEGFAWRGPVPDDPMAGLPRPEDDPPWVPIQLREPRTVFGPLDWAPIAEALPEDVARLAERAAELSAFGLDRRMRAVVRALQRIDWQTGRLLALVFSCSLHRLLGFPSAAAYVHERLGMSPRKARALVALDRKSRAMPALAGAYRDGDVSWVRALAIMAVATEDTTADWLARARGVTVRRLVDEVEWVIERRAAGVATDLAPPPAGTRLVRPARQVRAHEARLTDAEIVFYAPASLKVLLFAALGAFAKPREPSWQSLERLLDHVSAEWQRQPRHRDPVFARDGWRCAVPACTSRRNLHDHHLLYRSRGGGNARDNRITVCAWHHLRGIHQGRVRAWGTAPDDVTWELGSRPGYEPVLRLHGDEYVVAP